MQVPPEWVAMFNEGELQALISGAEGGEGAGLDIADLQDHVHYAGVEGCLVHHVFALALALRSLILALAPALTWARERVLLLSPHF